MKYLKYRKNKKKWTGEEAGRLLFMALAERTAAARGEKAAGEPLEVTNEILKVAEDALDKEQVAIYAVYRSLYHAITNYYNDVSKLQYEFSYSTQIIYESLDKVIKREVLTEDLEKQPLIMSRSKCLDLARSHRTSFYEIFFDVLQASITGTKEPPQAIIDALEELKRTPAKDIPLFEAYRQPTYTLHGKRLDELTDAELEEEITREWAANAGVEPTREALDAYKQKQSNLATELLFTGELRGYIENQTGVKIDCTDAELEEAIKCIFGDTQRTYTNGYISTISEAFKMFIEVTTATQKEFSENLTAFDLLNIVVEEGGKYESLENKEMQREYFKQVKNDLPQLFASLEAYIKEAAQLHDLREGGYYDKCCTYAELEERHIIGFNLQSDPAPAVIDLLKKGSIEEATYSDRMRAVKSGIALFNGDFEPIDPLGSYPNPLEDAENEREQVERAERLVYDALGTIHAYNAALELISIAFDIDDIRTAKVSLDKITETAEQFNRILYSINATMYGGNEEKAHKREQLKKIFDPIDLERGKPTRKQAARVLPLLEEFADNFETGYQITSLRQLIRELKK